MQWGPISGKRPNKVQKRGEEAIKLKENGHGECFKTGFNVRIKQA